MNFSDVRKQYPQYDDLDDAALAKGLHQKFYSDMPFDDFAARVGYAPQQKSPWLATLRERVTPDPSFEDDVDAGGIGIDPDTAKQSAESMTRIGGALAGGLAAFPAGGLAGAGRLIGEDVKDAYTALAGGRADFNGNLGKAAHTVEAVAGLPNRLLKTEGEQKALETIMKPMEWVENAGRFYGDAVYNATGDPNLAATAKTVFEAISFLGLPEMKAKLIKSARAGKAAELQRATTEAVDILNEIVAGEKAIRRGQKLKTKKQEVISALEKLQSEPRRLAQLSEIERRLKLRNYIPKEKSGQFPAKSARESYEAFATQDPRIKAEIEASRIPELERMRRQYEEAQRQYEQIRDYIPPEETGQFPQKPARESYEAFATQDPRIKAEIEARQRPELERLREQIAERDARGEYADMIRQAEERQRIENAAEYGTQPRSLFGGTRQEPATFTDPIRPERQQALNITRAAEPAAPTQTPAAPLPKAGVPAAAPTTGNLPQRGGRQTRPAYTRGPTTIGGAIRQFTGGKGISRRGVRLHAGNDIFRNLPQEARMAIKNGGVSLDLVEDYLKREGYLYPEQDLIEVLRQEPGAMGFGKIAVEGERSPGQRMRPEEQRVLNEPEYDPAWDEVKTQADIDALNEKSGQSVFDFFEQKARERQEQKAPSKELPKEKPWIEQVKERRETNRAKYEAEPNMTAQEKNVMSDIDRQDIIEPERAGVAVTKTFLPEKATAKYFNKEKTLKQNIKDLGYGLQKRKLNRYGTTINEVIDKNGKVKTRGEAETVSNWLKRKHGLAEKDNPIKKLFNDQSGSIKIDPISAKDRHLQRIADDEVLKKVHGMIGYNEKQTAMGDIWVGGMEKMIDRFDALGREKGRALNPIDKMGLPTSEAHKAALRFNSYKDVTAMKFNELAKAIPPSVRQEPLIFSDYVNAHRAKTRAARGLKNPNKVTLDDANAAIAAWEKKWTDGGRPLKALKDGYDAFQKWADRNILRDMVDAGIISKERYREIKDKNEHYASFDVLDHVPDDINAIPGSMPSKEYFSLANQDVVKAMTGTEKRIADPMEATFRKFMRAQELAARNRVASALIDDPLVSANFRRVAKSKKEFGILRNQKQNPLMDSQVPKTHEIINRFKDGRVESYAVPKEMAEAMKQLSPATAPRVLQAINRAFRKSATTLYIPFTVSNAMRDFIMAYSTSPTYKAHQLGNYILDWNKGFWEGVKYEFGNKSNIAQQYVKDGGGFGYSGTLRTAQGAKQGVFSEPSLRRAGATIIKTPFQLIEKMSGAVELAPRIAVYERAKRMGVSGEDAALLARRSTVDFNQAGTAMRVYNQWVPFLNARVQGKLNLARALRRDPKDTLAKVALTVALPGVVTYAWNRLNFSELYDDIPEYIKQNYFVIVTGTGTDERGRTAPKYHVISKGDTGQMAWNPIEYMLDRMWDKDREGATKFLVNFLSDVSPVEFAREGELSASKALSSTLPPPAKAVIEPAVNYSFYQGREVVPRYMAERVRPGKQAFDNTPQVYKTMGEKLGVAPLKIQNVMSNLFAGYGREGLDPDAMIKGLTGRLTKVKGGEHERKAWEDIEDLEAEYQYARSDAAEAVEAGDRKEALRIMRDWNKDAIRRITEYNKRFKKYGLGDKGGLRKNMFSYDKMRNVLMKRQDARPPIQRRLSVR